MLQRQPLGDSILPLKLPLPPDKVLTLKESMAYQRLIFRHLFQILGRDQVVLVESAEELSTPERRIFTIKITPEECLCLEHKMNFIVVHGLTRRECHSIPYRGVWTQNTYWLNASNAQEL